MKTSIRFFNDREVRAVWDDSQSIWWYSILDIVGVINDQDDYTKNRNYWKYLKRKLTLEDNELVSYTNQLKLTASDGKKYLTDVIPEGYVVNLISLFPNSKGMRFAEWFLGGADSDDSRSKAKAYTLFDSSLLESIEVGTIKGLQQIHGFLFGGIFEFAGQIREINIAKGGFQFAMAQYLPETLHNIEKMPENSLDEILDKYIEMNVAHPFREGNGRATRIWLDLMLKNNLKLCIDWSKVGKYEYLKAMEISVADDKPIKQLLKSALTDKINNREVFMKGIDYSYYYEDDISQIF